MVSAVWLAAMVLGTVAIQADRPAPVAIPESPAPQAQAGISPARQAWLIALCVETRFRSLAEVDTLSTLTPAEKGFCKDRLKLLNPLID